MYSVQFREVALLLYVYFKSLRKTSKILKVSISTLSRWNSSIEIKKRTRKSVKTSDALRNFITVQVINNPCLTCPLLCAQIELEFGFSISRQLVHLILKQSNFSFKRIRKRGFSKQKEEKTKTFIEQFKQNNKHSTTIISIDESGFDHRGSQIYGYAPKGTPAIVTTTYTSDRKRYNLLLAVSSKGEKYFKIYNQTITSEIYNSFLRELPIPKDHLVLMDNARIHKTNLVNETIVNRKLNVLFTPPYGPEYAPIELVFGQIKQQFYKARYTNKQPLGNIIRNITDSILPKSIRNSFTHVLDNFITCK